MKDWSETYKETRVEKTFFDLKPISFRGKIAVVAPSGHFDKQHFNAGITFLRLHKMKPNFNRAILFMKEDYLAGPAEKRAEDIISAFLNPEVEAIWAARGGFGAMHLLPLLDKHIDEIKKNPKLLIGFSDITALHSYLVDKCGFVTVHGPNITTLDQIDNYSQNQILNLLQCKDGAFSIFSRHAQPLQGGSAKGIIKGGNLSTLVSLIGTPYEPDLDGSILFLEDVGEVPYRIDRLLTQMRYAGKFSKIKGLILGDFSYKEKNPPATLNVDWNLILSKTGVDKNIPVLAGFPSGHNKHNMSFLLGAAGTLDADARTLKY